MALSKTSMAALIKAKVAAVAPVQGSDPAAVLAYRDAIYEALCDGIIEAITQYAEVTTTSGAPDGEHTGIIT